MIDAPKGNYIFNPPISRNEWLTILEILDKYHPQISWTGGDSGLLDSHTLNGYNEFGGTTEVYGISVDSSDNFRTMGDDSWEKSEAYIEMNNLMSMGETKDGREFFGLDFSTDDFFDMFESTNIKKIIRNILTEGLDDYWTHNDKTVTLRQLLDVTKDMPIKDIDTNKLSKIVLNWEGNPKEIEKIEKSDLQYPVLIIVDDDNSLKYIIDGNHRVQKSIKNNLPTVKAKLIKFSQLPQDFKDVLG